MHTRLPGDHVPPYLSKPSTSDFYLASFSVEVWDVRPFCGVLLDVSCIESTFSRAGGTWLGTHVILFWTVAFALFVMLTMPNIESRPECRTQ